MGHLGLTSEVMLTPLIKMVKKLILSRVFLYNQHLNLELSHCIESSASITAVILNDYSIRESDDSILRRF